MTLTQILQKIKSAFYTKTETESKLNAKANSSDLNNYLPKSGGQISGNIFKSSDSSNLVLGGATEWQKGAFVNLYGENHAEYPGDFVVEAHSSSGGKALRGKTNGSLTWAGKNVDTIEEQGDGYIRYSNGIQICWGECTNSSGVATVSYPVSFSGAKPKVMLTRIGIGANILSYNVSESTTSVGKFKFFSASGSAEPTSVSCIYLAIGKWK